MEQNKDFQQTDNLKPEDIAFLQTLGKKHDVNDGAIGRRKYEFLKTINSEYLTAEQVSQIEDYELKFVPTEKQIELQSAYWDKILSKEPEKPFEFTTKQLWQAFKFKFQEISGKPFEKTKESISNLEPVMYYFAKDERFFKCENLTKISNPSFDKGLLIVGGFGNGKTTIMRTFEALFKTVKNYSFKSYSANEVVVMFEKCHEDIDRVEFENIMFKGVRYFDDVKTERIASNYGKVNIFKDIIETRYDRGNKTYITCNYVENNHGNLEMALSEFGEKYGGRVFDRIYEMFNIIEFKGKSFRK